MGLTLTFAVECDVKNLRKARDFSRAKMVGYVMTIVGLIASTCAQADISCKSINHVINDIKNNINSYSRIYYGTLNQRIASGSIETEFSSRPESNTDHQSAIVDVSIYNSTLHALIPDSVNGKDGSLLEKRALIVSYRFCDGCIDIRSIHKDSAQVDADVVIVIKKVKNVKTNRVVKNYLNRNINWRSKSHELLNVSDCEIYTYNNKSTSSKVIDLFSRSDHGRL